LPHLGAGFFNYHGKTQKFTKLSTVIFRKINFFSQYFNTVDELFPKGQKLNHLQRKRKKILQLCTSQYSTTTKGKINRLAPVKCLLYIRKRTQIFVHMSTVILLAKNKSSIIVEKLGSVGEVYTS
jgi:hypothetical protein